MSKIKSISVRPILDSSGGQTIKVTVKTDDGYVGAASVPQGKSKGSGEAPYVSVATALKNIKVAEKLLKGIDVADQKKIDDILLPQEIVSLREMSRRDTFAARNDEIKSLRGAKRRGNLNNIFLGGNVTIGVSMAVARAAAVSKKVELWEYLRAICHCEERPKGATWQSKRLLRGARNDYIRLLINCIEGGVHAKNGPAFQEYLVAPKGKTVAESIKIGQQFYQALKKYLKNKYNGKIKLGDEGGFVIPIRDNLEPLRILQEIASSSHCEEAAKAADVAIFFGLDVAANNVKLPNKKLKELYAQIIAEFPLIYLEDPFAEKRFERLSLRGVPALAVDDEAISKDCHGANAPRNDGLYIVGDDLTVTNPRQMQKAHQKNLINGVIIKPNQIGTVTKALEAVKLARQYGWFVCVSHRGRETMDDFIADFAVAANADGVKFGGFGQPERLAKYKRLLKVIHS